MAGFEQQQEESPERWERAARGWGRRADYFQEFGMRVSVWMVEHLDLQPGQQVLDLAAGPGDTGFLAAELVLPGGTLISSDASRAMLGVARGRARDLGVSNVEFRQIELEWIDLDTASIDAALCRWGLMLTDDPGTALQEIRRVLRPGGRVTLAVWSDPERNPWATIPTRAMVELKFAQPPDPSAPGMFALADPALLRELLESAGFVEVLLDRVDLRRDNASVEDYIETQLDLSGLFAEARDRLSDHQWSEVKARIGVLAEPYAAGDGSVEFPARSLVAAASA
jgi:ubiquinone/menaquinone biosynthesis C-methylase UbiE